jgi:hypothetical protein
MGILTNLSLNYILIFLLIQLNYNLFFIINSFFKNLIFNNYKQSKILDF